MKPNAHRLAQRMLAVLCALLVVVRVGDAHLHVCLDGAESPVSLHAVDVQSHHANELTIVDHSDFDLQLSAESAPRTGGDEPAAILPAHEVLPGCPALQNVSSTSPLAFHPSIPPRYLLPPVCGPPRSRLV
jgi:hypothetical protein